MKKIILLSTFCVAVAIPFAQKKLVPVSQSTLTGISLPTGSKQDHRMLSEVAAQVLLEIKSKKNNTNVSAVEVLVLPSVTSSGFNEDSLVTKLADLGWNITPIEGDVEYAWLQKDNLHVIAYFSMDPKETHLYYGKASVIPTINQPGNNTTMQPPVGTENNQPQQPVNTENSQPQQPTNTNVQNTPVETTPPANQPIANSGFAFTTTNFDNGWTSTVQEDWVEVTKGVIKILVHYPNKNADAYNTVLLEGLKNAWDVLVAPKYSSASNFEFKPLQSWESVEYAEADAVEKSTGKTVHVVFFKKNFSGGGGKYVEFITPDKNSFEQEFGAYVNDITASKWDKMANMAIYNKFAVAAADLTGKWTTSFSGIQQYVNVYTGADAGMDTHSSAEKFEFESGNTYHWEIAVANGFVGNIKFDAAKATGKWTLLNNWQIHFSEIEKKPKTYNAFFSCVKGARILWLQDTGYGGYTAFAKAE